MFKLRAILAFGGLWTAAARADEPAWQTDRDWPAPAASRPAAPAPTAPAALPVSPAAVPPALRATAAAAPMVRRAVLATNPDGAVRLVSAQQDAAPAPPPTPKVVPPGAPKDGVPPEIDLGRPGRDFGNVKVTPIGPNQVMIEGTPTQVEDLVKLIEQLDKIGGLAEPGIATVRLEHQESAAMARVLKRVYEAKRSSSGVQAAGAGAGLVEFIPIAQPNALVIVARKIDLVDIAAQVQELDASGKGGERFQLMPLTHANATLLAPKLQSFFSGTGTAAQAVGGAAAPNDANNAVAGLRMRLEVVADERTNSLLVHGGPGDLKLVSELVAELDKAGSNLATADIRYFKLKNAAASDLAATLGDAILRRATTAATAQAAGAAPAANQANQIPGAGGQGATAAPTAPIKSSRLRMAGPRAAQMIESGILEDVTITPDTRTNSLLVTAPKETMDFVGELIKMLDAVPNPIAKLRMFELKNADANAMLNTLQSFFAGNQSQTGAGGNQFGGVPLNNQTGTGAAGQTQPQSFAIGGAEPQLSLVPLSFAVDVRTNTLLVYGSPNDMDVVELFILRLDGNTARERRSFVYRLKSIKATDAQTAITTFIQNQATNAATSALTAAATGNTLTLQQQIAQDVVVVAEATSNQLIISASPRYFDEVLKLIQAVDHRPPQVAIKVLIAQVEMDDAEEFGVEWGLQNNALFNRGVVSQNSLLPGFNFLNPAAPAGLNDPGLPNAVLANRGAIGVQGLSSFGFGTTSATQGFGGLVLRGGNDNVNFLLRALKRQSRLQVLSRPQIVALDNRESTISIGKSVPLISGSTQSALGNITNTVTYKDVGVLLAVNPQINPDDSIVLQVKPTVSSIDVGNGVSIGNGAIAPVINQITLQSYVTASDGQTIILGGLLTRERNQDIRKLPGIGDWPILGNLFRTDTYTSKKTELIIVLTPYIIRSDTDMEAFKAEELAKMHWCMPDVLDVHSDPAIPARPSPDGTDRRTVSQIMPIPESAKLPLPDANGNVPTTTAAPATGLPAPTPNLLPMPAAPPAAVPGGVGVPLAAPPGGTTAAPTPKSRFQFVELVPPGLRRNRTSEAMAERVERAAQENLVPPRAAPAPAAPAAAEPANTAGRNPDYYRPWEGVRR